MKGMQYVLFGVGLTLITLVGALFLVEQRAQADEGGVTANQATVPALSVSQQRESEQIETHDSPSDASSATQRPVEDNSVLVQASADSPETDFDKVSGQIVELAAKYETNYLGDSGWFYQKTEHYLPPEYMSNTGAIYDVPVESIRPEATMLKEQWFLIDEFGQYQRKVGHDVDQEGTVHNRWAITNGKLVFLNLVEASNDATQDVPPAERRSISSLYTDVLTLLDLARANAQTVRGWYDGNEYTVVVEIVEEEPVSAANLNVTIIGHETKWVFDLTSGALKNETHSIRIHDGSLLTMESTVILSQGMVEQPPVEALQTLDEATQIVQEGIQ